MEAVGLAVGIAGLAGLFSSCLEVIDKLDSYREYNSDSKSLALRFKVEKIRFKQWGSAVGIQHGKLPKQHHPALEDTSTRATVEEILRHVQRMCDDDDAVTSQLNAKPAEDKLSSLGLLQPHRVTAKESTRVKLDWVFREKKKRTSQLEHFSTLVDSLYDLIPPDRTKGKHIILETSTDGSKTGHQQVSDPLGDATWASEFREYLAKVEKESEAEERKRIRAWLGQHNPNDIYIESTRKRLRGTCDWILNEPAFQTWLSSTLSSNSPSLLWINGPAGFGKTVLCARVIEHLLSTIETPLAHFFLSSDFDGRDDPFVTVRVWIDQVISHNRTAFCYVRDRWASQNEQTASRETIVNLFRGIIQTVPGCIFVLDGLDECAWMARSQGDDNSIDEFLHRVLDAIANTDTRLMLVTRTEPKIGAVVSKATGFLELRVSQEHSQPDIKLYSRSIVNRKLESQDEATKDAISRKMADRCDGLFLWLKLHENSLKANRRTKWLEDAIDKTPLGLNRAYERVWSTIEQQPEPVKDRAFSILRWTAFATRPLTVNEITEATLIDENHGNVAYEDLPLYVNNEFVNDEIHGPCGSLVEIRRTDNQGGIGLGTVHLAHFTVKQYVLGKLSVQLIPLKANEALRSSHEALQNTLLAKLCLLYISHTRVWNNNIPEDGTFVENAFRDYAANAWFQHAMRADETNDSLMPFMETLLDPDNHVYKLWQNWYDLRSITPADEQSITVVRGGPLHYSVRLEFPKLLKHLLDVHKYNVDEGTSSGLTALHLASAFGHIEPVNILLRAGANPTIAAGDGWTPIHMASWNGHSKIIRILLEANADVMAGTDNGLTPLHVCLSSNHIEAVQLLLDGNAEINARCNNNKTPLHYASGDGYAEIVSLLLKAGADVTAVDNDGLTPLHAASTCGHADVVRILLLHHACTAAQDNYKRTPLYSASRGGHTEVIELLLESNDDIEISNESGRTPLCAAALNGHIEVVRVLLARGADIEAADIDQRTCLHAASRRGHFEIAKLLLDQGACIASYDYDGWTPLHAATTRGHTEVVKLLLENKADARICNKFGKTPLLSAAENGLLELVRLFLDKISDVDTQDNEGRTALFLALKNGHTEVARLLLQMKADARIKDKNGWTALSAASSGGHSEAVELLLNNSADTATRNEEGLTPLHIASSRGDVTITRLLLENGADVLARTDHKFTPIYLASLVGSVETVQLLLDEHADITVQNIDGLTPLHAASMNGHVSVVKLLIENGANVHVLHNDGWTSLNMASLHGHVNIVQLLLENDADITVCNKYKFSTLHSACHNGHIDVVKLLLEQGKADVNVVDEDGSTPLHEASAEGHSAIVKLLLNHHADLSITDIYGATALHGASANGYYKIVRLLLREGADILAGNDECITPLFLASQHGHYKLVKLLLKKGADVTKTDSQGFTPLHGACRQGHRKVATLLLRHHADHSVRSKNEVTALYLASGQGHLDIVKLLIQENADVSASDNDGWTPLLVASANGHVKVVEILVEHGADITTRNNRGLTPLFVAAANQHPEVVDFFYERM